MIEKRIWDIIHKYVDNELEVEACTREVLSAIKEA